MAAIEFEWDSRDLAFWRGRGMEKALNRAVRLAGNRALREMQGESIGRIKRRKFVRRERVKRGLPLEHPRARTSTLALLWRMKASGAPVPLSFFPYLQTAAGVSVRVNAGQGTRRLKSAFVVTLRSGHVGIFRRRAKARLPIDQLWTTRISDSMRDEGLIPAVQSKARAQFERSVQRGLKRELAKAMRKGLA